jgi:hypothetical protein
MKRIFTGGALALLLGAVVYAQASLAGRWTGETKNGSQVTLDLTVNGETFTGTLTNNGEAMPLSDGKVSKNTFTFSAVRNDTKETFTGEFTGDEMMVWMDRQGRDRAAVLKRAKKGDTHN